MEILYIGGFRLPDKNAAAQRVMGIAKSLKDLNNSITFMGVSNKDEIINVNGSMTYNYKYPESFIDMIKYQTSVKKYVNVIKNRKIELIICYNLPSVCLLRILLFAKKNNIRVISDCTEWYEHKNIIKKLDSEVRMRIIHKKLDGIICISNSLQYYYENYLPTIYIPPTINKYDLKWKSPSFGKYSDFSLIYAGNAGRTKDKLNLLIDFYNKVKEERKINLYIVGISIDDFLLDYPDYEKKDLSKIKFLGRKSHNETIELIKQCHYMIFIREKKKSNDFGFPTKFVEALACKTPVITTRTTDLEKYLHNRVNGFFVDINANYKEQMMSILSFDYQYIYKNWIKKNPFDYRLYTSELKLFIDNICK